VKDLADRDGYNLRFVVDLKIKTRWADEKTEQPGLKKV
jgi:hypothetical protein